LKKDLNKIKKESFFSWKKDNAVKVKCIWSTEKTQGTRENKTFENVWCRFSHSKMKKGFAESPIKKKVGNGKGSQFYSFLFQKEDSIMNILFLTWAAVTCQF
jgi:hypothetical protein